MIKSTRPLVREISLRDKDGLEIGRPYHCEIELDGRRYTFEAMLTEAGQVAVVDQDDDADELTRTADEATGPLLLRVVRHLMDELEEMGDLQKALAAAEWKIENATQRQRRAEARAARLEGELAAEREKWQPFFESPSLPFAAIRPWASGVVELQRPTPAKTGFYTEPFPTDVTISGAGAADDSEEE